MKMTDALALALKGCSAEEIKEIKELEKTSPEVLELAKSGQKLSDIKSIMALADPDDGAGDNAGQDTGERVPEADPEKVKIEKENAELKDTIKQLQSDIFRKDLSGSEPKEKTIEELMHELLE